MLKALPPAPAVASRALATDSRATSAAFATPLATAAPIFDGRQQDLRALAALTAPSRAPSQARDTVDLSATAQLLTLADADSREHETPALPTIRSQLGEATLTAGGVRLAEAIRLTLEESGLFYESHLRDWVAGERSESVVLREAARRLAEGQSGLDLASLKLQVGLLLNPRLALILTHPHGRFDLDIRRESAPHQTAMPAVPVWHISIETELPRLGRLVMQISLAGNSLQLVARHHNRQTVQNQWPRLATKLRACGFVLDHPRWEYCKP